MAHPASVTGVLPWRSATCHGIGTVLSITLFAWTIVEYEPLSRQDRDVLAAVWCVAVAGSALGLAVGLSRIRPALMLFALGIAWSAHLSCSTGNPDSQVGPVAIRIAWRIGPWFVLAGYAAVSTRLDVFALTGSLAGLVVALLEVGQHAGEVERWTAGPKWTFFAAPTTSLLAWAVGLIAAQLAAREADRLQQWASGPPAPLPSPSAGVPSKTRSGHSSILLLVLVTLASSLTVPYLLRRGPGDGEGRGGDFPAAFAASRGGHASEPTFSMGPLGSDGGATNSPTVNGLGGRAFLRTAISLILLVLMGGLAIVSVLLFGPPFRRLVVLNRLRASRRRIGPIARIRLRWRLVELALCDLGFRRQPGDSATGFARRVIATGRLIDPEPLLRCAEVADRAVYGL